MSPKVKLSVYERSILAICSEIEDAVALLYRYFSGLYADNDNISKLFITIALEEEDHSNQFKFANRLCGTGMKSVNTDSQQIETILKRIKSVYEAVQKSPPILKDALDLLINIETLLSEYHMNTIVVFENEKLSRLFNSMRNNDDIHVQMLKQVMWPGFVRQPAG